MKKENGALLLSFIFMFTIAAILCSSMAYLSQNETYSLKPVNSIEQSYYLSESGLRFGRFERDNNRLEFNDLELKYEHDKYKIEIPRLSDSPDDTAPEETVGTISLSFDKPPSSGDDEKKMIIIHSKAELDSHNFVEAIRQTNARYRTGLLDDNEGQAYILWREGLAFLQSSIYKLWHLTSSFQADYSIQEGLQFKSNNSKIWVLASLFWSKNDLLPDLASWQDQSTKELSYNLQLKFNIYPSAQTDIDFMTGLSFRIGMDRENFYGISFFKSSGRSVNNPPCWLDPEAINCDALLGDSFQFNGENDLCDFPNTKCLDSNTPYLIFWIKNKGEPFELIAFSDLTTLKYRNRIISKNSSKWNFKPWITLGIHVQEQEYAGQKLNDIQVFVKKSSDSSDDIDTDIDYNWNDELFWEQIEFEKLDNPNYLDKKHIRDIRLPSTDLSKEPPSGKEYPDEIGFHALYDNRLKESQKYDIYFYGFIAKETFDDDDTQEFVQY